MDSIPADGMRRQGWPMIWQATFCEDTQAREFSWSKVEMIAADSVCWQNLLHIVPQETGRTKH